MGADYRKVFITEDDAPQTTPAAFPGSDRMQPQAQPTQHLSPCDPVPQLDYDELSSELRVSYSTGPCQVRLSEDTNETDIARFPGAQPFADAEEMNAAFADPRYQHSASFRALVAARLSRSL